MPAGRCRLLAAIVLEGFIPHLPDATRAWLVLAMSAAFAGNLTVLGSVANLIVVERARHHLRISFREIRQGGVPLTLVTLAVGIWMLN